MTFHRGDLQPKKSPKQIGQEKGSDEYDVLQITEAVNLAEPELYISAHRSHT
jgi:hypothetical protein